MKNQGKVLWFNRDKGYGFISIENGYDVFVHYSEYEGDLNRNDLVEFEVIPGDRGPKATNVRKIETAEKQDE
jgi:CspA family cold shock protein